MTKDEYETNARRLIGKAVKWVIYHEIDYRNDEFYDDKFYFFEDPRFDSLDFGLELEFNTGQFLSITWGSEFYQYGVSLINGRFSRVVSGARALDVSKTIRWKTVLGKPIESVDIFWNGCWDTNNPEARIDYPQDLLLQFEGESARVISALEIQENHWFMGMTDHITVFDDLKTAKNFKCLIDS